MIRLEGFTSVTVTNRTIWTFADFVSADGARTTVEITAGDSVMNVARDLDAMVARICERDIESEDEIESMLGLSIEQLGANRVIATAVSGLRSAVVQLQAHSNGVSLTEALGGQTIESVPLYANINRSLLGENRTPRAFALAGEKAADQGFNVIKCAPFDDIDSGNTTKRLLEAAKIGISRVAAVRSAVGPNVEVLVDCHSCFDRDSSLVVAGELANLGIGWFEEPLEPTQDPEGLAYVAGRVSMPVAGGESGYGETFFANLVNRGAIRIVMPDVKYCGGVAEAYRIGRSAVQMAGSISIHSPSGPVSQLASACVTAAIPGAMALEHAVDEAPWRSEILEPPERIENGRFWFPKGATAALNMDVMSLHGTTWVS